MSSSGWYRSQDGYRIPKSDSPLRVKWDNDYLQRVQDYFGHKGVELVPVDVPVSKIAGGHNVMPNHPRTTFYQKLYSIGERVPPIVVSELGTGHYNVLDGNRRIFAAKAAGKSHIPGLVIRPVKGAKATTQEPHVYTNTKAKPLTSKLKKSEDVVQKVDDDFLVDFSKNERRAPPPLPKRIAQALWALHQPGVLTDELRKPEYRENPNPFAGHCFVATNALFHLIDGARTGWQQMCLHREHMQDLGEDTHWFLQHKKTGHILDATADQFEGDNIPYAKGVAKGTSQTGTDVGHPTKRAQVVIDRVRSLLDEHPKEYLGTLEHDGNEWYIQPPDEELVKSEDGLWWREFEVDEPDEPLEKMALVHDDPKNPRTIYRIQNQQGEGPYRGSEGSVVSQYIPTAADRFTNVSLRGDDPSPYGDFETEDISHSGLDMMGFGSPTFGFPTPEAALRWFGDKGIATLAEHGFHLNEVPAAKVWQSQSGSQAMFHPADVPEGGKPFNWAKYLADRAKAKNWPALAPKEPVKPVTRRRKAKLLAPAGQMSFTDFAGGTEGVSTQDVKRMKKAEQPPSRMSLEDVHKKYKYFHISRMPLHRTGDTWLAKPRVPKSVMWEEDHQTPRTCVGPTIHHCIAGVEGEVVSRAKIQRYRGYHVYGVPHTATVVQPTPEQVPDVETTSERWLTQPTKLKYLGAIAHDPGKGIQADWAYGIENDPSLFKANLGKKVLDPSLGYKISSQPHPSGIEVFAHAPTGQLIGRSIIGPDERGVHIPHLTYVEEEHQRKGVASAMYQHAEKMTGQKLHPSQIQSEDAEKLWAAPRAFGKGEGVYGGKAFMAGAAFRHLKTGRVFNVGPWHDTTRLPGGLREDPDPKMAVFAPQEDATGNLANYEAGFVDHSGRFYNRTEAAKAVGAQSKTAPPHVRLTGLESNIYQLGLQDKVYKSEPKLSPGGLRFKSADGNSEEWDYSHLLPEKTRQEGYRIKLRTFKAPPPMGPVQPENRIQIFATKSRGDNTRPAGQLVGSWDDKTLKPWEVRVEDQDQRKRIGLSMYEAMYAHGRAHLGTNEVAGDYHSTSSHLVHKKLPSKYGLNYEAKPNVGRNRPYSDMEEWSETPPHDMDARYGNYKYKLPALGKGEPIDPFAESKKDFDLEHESARKLTTGEMKLHQVPYYESYRNTAAAEAKLMGPAAKNVLFVGSGPVPMSSMLFAKEHGKNVSNVELDPGAAKVGHAVASAQGHDFPTHVGDAAHYPHYGKHDAVVVALEAGITPEQKGAIFERIARDARPDAPIIVRSSADRTGVFPNVEDYVGNHFSVAGHEPTFDGLSRSYLLKRKGLAKQEKSDRTTCPECYSDNVKVRLIGEPVYECQDCKKHWEYPYPPPDLSKGEIDQHESIASVIMVQDGLGRTLWGKRRKDGKYTMPGGHADRGEPPEQAAVRELYEEAGLVPETLWYLGSGNGLEGPVHVYHCIAHGQPTVENDPDREMLEWVWVDCLLGPPPEITNNLAHNPDIVAQLMHWPQAPTGG